MMIEKKTEPIYPVVDRLITNALNRPMRKNQPVYLVVHWTANQRPGADALAHAGYFNTTRHQVSAHYVVDERQTLRCIPEEEMAYSVGARFYTSWARNHLGDRPNGRVISVEMCVNSDGRFWLMYSRTAHLCATILKGRGWEISQLIRHYDITGKNCPAFFVQDWAARKFTGKPALLAWQDFRRDVVRLMK